MMNHKRARVASSSLLCSRMLDIVGCDDDAPAETHQDASLSNTAATHIIECDNREMLASFLPVVQQMLSNSLVEEDLLVKAICSRAFISLSSWRTLITHDVVSVDAVLAHLDHGYLLNALVDYDLPEYLLHFFMDVLTPELILQLAQVSSSSGRFDVSLECMKRSGRDSQFLSSIIVPAALKCRGETRGSALAVFQFCLDYPGSADTACNSMHAALLEREIHLDVAVAFRKSVGGKRFLGVLESVFVEGFRLASESNLFRSIRLASSAVERAQYIQWESKVLGGLHSSSRNSSAALVAALTSLLHDEDAFTIRCHLKSIGKIAGDRAFEVYRECCKERLRELGEPFSTDPDGAEAEVEKMVQLFSASGGLIPDELARKATLASGWFKEVFVEALLRPSPRVRGYFENESRMEPRDLMILALSNNKFGPVTLERARVSHYRASCLSMRHDQITSAAQRKKSAIDNYWAELQRLMTELTDEIQRGDEQERQTASSLHSLISKYERISTNQKQTVALMQKIAMCWLSACSVCSSRITSSPKPWISRLISLIADNFRLVRSVLDCISVYFTVTHGTTLTNNNVWAFGIVLSYCLSSDSEEVHQLAKSVICSLPLSSVPLIMYAAKMWLMTIKASSVMFSQVSVEKNAPEAKSWIPLQMLQHLHFSFLRLQFLQRRNLLNARQLTGVNIVKQFFDSPLGRDCLAQTAQHTSISDWLVFELTFDWPIKGNKEGISFERIRYFHETLFEVWHELTRPATIAGILVSSLVRAVCEIPPNTLRVDSAALGCYSVVLHRAMANANQVITLRKLLSTLEKAFQGHSSSARPKRIDVLLAVFFPLMVSTTQLERSEVEQLHQFLATHCGAKMLWYSSPMLTDLLLDACKGMSAEDHKWLLDQNHLIVLSVARHWPRHRFEVTTTLKKSHVEKKVATLFQPPKLMFENLTSDKDASLAGAYIFDAMISGRIQLDIGAMLQLRCRLAFWATLIDSACTFIQQPSREMRALLFGVSTERVDEGQLTVEHIFVQVLSQCPAAITCSPITVAKAAAFFRLMNPSVAATRCPQVEQFLETIARLRKVILMESLGTTKSRELPVSVELQRASGTFLQAAVSQSRFKVDPSFWRKEIWVDFKKLDPPFFAHMSQLST